MGVGVLSKVLPTPGPALDFHPGVGRHLESRCPARMHILISNDDGYDSPGLKTLVSLFSESDEVSVVAPDHDRSGASNSLTLDRPLHVTRVAPNVYSVDGTPTDCVHLGITGLFREALPDMVLSGINHGENLGDDVVYSGTVAAAMEGRYLGFPAIAVSSMSKYPRHLETAAAVAKKLVERLKSDTLPTEIILNVNVPDVSLDSIKGFCSTRLGNRHIAEPAIADSDPRGNPIYWIGASGPEQDAGPGTDFHALAEGYVSVTPLHVDLTRHRHLETVGDWLEGMC